MSRRLSFTAWILALFCIPVAVVRPQAVRGSCPADRDSVEVEPESDVVIGAVLDLHEPGNGIFGCGKPSAEGLHYFEALRWAVQRLNKEDGYINGRSVDESFIPGLKFGLQAYDSCGHRGLSLRYMTEMFPILTAGANTCQPFKENITKIIGMVDASGVSNTPRVSDAINKYVIPVIPLNQATSVPPEQLAKVIAEVVHDTNWERVAILHADDEYSLYVTKVFGQISFSGFPCIAAMKSFPSSVSGNAVSLRKVLSSLTGKLSDSTGVIVVAHGEALKRVLQELKDSPELGRLQWLFSWLPPSEDLEEILRVGKLKRLFSLSPYPQQISEFEGYWAKLQDVGSWGNSENYWFLDYATFKKSCRVPGHQGKSYGNTVSCENLIVKESPVEQLMRTSRFLPALHSVFTFANAYKKAWQEKCLGISGMCSELREMTRQEFVEQYLEPLQFEHLPELRSPEEVRGQKTNQTARGEMDNVQIALNAYYLSQNQGLYFKQVFSYDSQEAKILDESFHSQPSTCPRKGCTNCVSIRQSRLDSSDHEISSSEDFVTVARSNDVLIPIVLPIHESGSNPMECGSTINPRAVQDLEAALWTIDQINEDPQYLQGVQLGVVAIDSCSSPVTLTQRLSNFLVEMQQKSPDDFTSSLAVISSGTAEEFSAVSSVLSPLNVTVVSSSDAIRADRMRGHFLQTAIPIETKVEAVVQTLKYHGWTYVPVLYDFEGRNFELLTLFKKFAAENGICLATELAITNLDHVEVDFVMTQLVQAKSQGAKVIVLWAGELTTTVFLESLRRAISAGIVSSTDFVIICNGDWVKDLNSFRGFDNQTIGAITFKPEQGEVTDFVSYYQRLQSMRNRRNPWFEELQSTKAPCFGPDCETDTRPVSPSTVNMIQAVLAISAGLARLRNDVCHPERGLCSRLMQQPHIRDLFHKYVHETASSRLDFKGEMFTFTKNGYGSIPVNIISFRKGVGNTLTHQKAGTYKNYKVEFSSSVVYSAVGEELALDDILSTCIKDCQTCGQRSPDFLILDSEDDIYLSATMGIHESSINPLVCGSTVTSQNMQILEAFLWAVDQINSSPQLLPGVQLGTIVFDTCNSRERAARDVSNFLSESLRHLPNKSSPKVDQVMGFLATQKDDVVESVVDVTMPFNILTIATEITSTKFNDAEKYPTLLRASLPNDVVADGLVDLLKHFRWSYVSCVYSDDTWNQGDLFQVFKDKAERRSVEFAVAEKISSTAEALMVSVLNKLKAAKEKGARVVVLLLNQDHMKSFFAGVARLQDAGRMSAADFLWIGVDNLEAFHKYADVALGGIMLRPTTSTVIPFKQYFESLQLINNSRNPWFREFWEQVTKCRGSDCYRKSNVAHPPFLQNPVVPSVINSVLSMGVGIETLRSRLCPRLERGLCPAMKSESTLREMLLNVTRSSSFMGVHGELFKFTKKHFAAGTLDIFNFVQVGNNARAFVEAGKFSPDEGISLNYSKVKAYDDDGREISLYNVKSQCLDAEACHGFTDNKETSMMQIIPQQGFAISAVMPVHRRGKTFFDCGELKDDHMFQNLAAMSYAIQRINTNDTLLPKINLGGIVFDFCGRKQKAEEQLYGYFSKDKYHQHNAKVSPTSVIATVTFGEDGIAKNLAPILEASNVVQIAAPSDQMNFNEDNDILYTVPPAIMQVQVLLSILKKFNWNYVSLIYSNTEFGRSSYYQFSKDAKKEDICLADILMLEPDSSPEVISSAFDVELESADSKVILLLVDNDDLINNTIEAAKRSAILHKYVWLNTNTWGVKTSIAERLHNSMANVITVQLESSEVPDFLDYFTNMSPHRHDPIPDSWFDEWWQHNFQCRLKDSLSEQIRYSRMCTGQEHVNKELVTQDKQVYHTMMVVEAIAKGLHNYLTERCPLGLSVTSIDDCGPDSREELEKEFKRMISGVDPDCEECGPLGTMFGYDVFQLRTRDDGVNTYVKVGNWKGGILRLNDDEILWAPSGTVPESTCQINCGKCASQLGNTANLANLKHAIFQNFKEVWGIAVSSLSILGMVLVIICALYFLMSFPVTIGTTVLGYMILFGLFLLYGVNFAFIISPTESTCGVRRFGLGLAYAVIFSGMLVKVMNTWRIMGYNGSRMLNDGTRLSSPAGLLVIAVGLVIIQVVLSAAWLILMPPKIGAYEMVWRCAPPTTFEEGLVVSLVYVMLLLAITTLFAILTWQCQDNNRESRWILACSTIVAVIWLAWTILSTQMSPHHRDLTIAVANLVNATVIMVCLYLRKVYLYSKLTRQAKDQDLKAHLQPASYPHSVYGSSQKSGPFSTLAPVLYGSQASLNGKKLYNGPSSRLELINCPEDNKSDSSGSVQVQAADLYPLDMYDGGSQFQPISSLFGSNHTLVLDDTLTFGR